VNNKVKGQLTAYKPLFIWLYSFTINKVMNKIRNKLTNTMRNRQKRRPSSLLNKSNSILRYVLRGAGRAQ